MKKLATGFVIVLAAAVAGVYLFIPSQYAVSTSIILKGNVPAWNRMLGNNSVWAKCLQPATVAADSGVSINGYAFKVLSNSMGQVSVSVQSKEINTVSPLLILSIGRDSMMLNWTTNIAASANPLNRIGLLFKEKELAAVQQNVLSRFKQYLAVPANVYGFDIVPGNMTDSIVITSSFITSQQPGLQEIYARINAIEQYAKAGGANATNAPMLFVQKNPEGEGFRTQVALPVDKQLNSTATFTTKNMVLGNNLTAVVQGPPSKIREAFNAMYLFVADYSRTMPGIPYEMLLNNRLQTDSSQWQTKIYFPVM